MKVRNYLFYLILFSLFIISYLFINFYKEKTKPPIIKVEEALLFFKGGDTLFQGPLYLEEEFDIKLEVILKAKKEKNNIYFSNSKNIIYKGKKIPEFMIEPLSNLPYILKFLWFTYEPEKTYYYLEEDDFKWKSFFIDYTEEPFFSPPLQGQNTSFLANPPFGEYLGKYFGTIRYMVRVELYDKRAPRVPFKVFHSANMKKPETAQMVVFGKGSKDSLLYYFTSFGNLPFFSIPSGGLQIYKEKVRNFLSKRWGFGTLLFCQPEGISFKVRNVLWDGVNLKDIFGKDLIWDRDILEGDSMVSQTQIIIFYERYGDEKFVSKNTKILSHTKTPLLLGQLSDISKGEYLLMHYLKK